MMPTDRRHSRNISGSSSGSAPSLSVSMTRLDEPPRPHPNRLIPSSSPQQQQQPPTVPHYLLPQSQEFSRPAHPTSVSSSPKVMHSINSSNSINSTKSASSTNSNNLNNIHLTRISSPSHLSSLPPEFLSSDARRPLLHVDEQGNDYKYFLTPMKYSVIFILLVEMMERFSFYGINYTTTAYLTGEYNDDWNADMPSIVASSYVSISTAVAYTTPFIGALLADNFFGEYMTILMGCLICYIPGLCLIAMSTVPKLLGEVFNHSAIRWGLLVLWPVGTGSVKACVNVFGAKQFHPILQSSMIESYYVNFYMCINIGALTGGIIVPIVAQKNITVAYCIPVFILGVGVLMFAAGSGKYVKPKPKHEINVFSGDLVSDLSRVCGCSKWRRSQKARDAAKAFIQPSPTERNIGISTIAMVSALVIPFNVAYAQMSTSFILQGQVMRSFGVVDASMMNNADAISVLAFGYIIGNLVYPALNQRQIKIPTTYKFAIGSAFAAAAIGCAIITDYQIHRIYRETGEAISVLWQAFPYFLIGIGEIFAVSAAYEVAFTVAPAKMKSLASAANLFMVGGAPNVFCIMLYNACRSWFMNAHGTANIHKLKDYSTAKVVNYFWLLEAVTLFGVIINILPPVTKWVASIEEEAATEIKSPMNTPIIRKNLMQRRQLRKQEGNSDGGADEESPLIKAQKHANYLKYGSGPQLFKMGSMRAGPSLKKASTPHSRRTPVQISPLSGGTNYSKIGNDPIPCSKEAHK